jgi:cytosine/adenosine deaminase-related metal-dependent hydrolase
VRALQQTDAMIDPAHILEMVTIHGAHALGQTGTLGELSFGAAADCIAVPYHGPVERAVESVLQHQGPVSGTWIGGELVFQHGLPEPIDSPSI